MALSSLSLFVYGLQVTTLNQNLDFKASSGGSTLTAVLNLGFYSPGSLADEVVRALNAADADNTYTVTITRNVLGGTQNRMTISTSGSFLSLLFSSGPNTLTTCASLLGFNTTDYTGSTTYTSSATIGTPLIPTQLAYNYRDDSHQAKVFGAVNVSASGLKEAVTFNIQKFIDVEFKYEPKTKVLNEWKPFFNWAIQQRPVDFTPQISDPDTYFQVTLEKTQYESKGLGFQFKEMLPNFPNFYTTGALNFRIFEAEQQFLSG